MSEPSWPDEVAPTSITLPAASRAGAARGAATRRAAAREAAGTKDDSDDSLWQSAVVRMGTALALWLGY